VAEDRKEHTTRESLWGIGAPYYVTTIIDSNGRTSKGVDYDKDKSIEKAHRDWREKHK
jgi:hypothetical protein